MSQGSNFIVRRVVVDKTDYSGETEVVIAADAVASTKKETGKILFDPKSDDKALLAKWNALFGTTRFYQGSRFQNAFGLAQQYYQGCENPKTSVKKGEKPAVAKHFAQAGPWNIIYSKEIPSPSSTCDKVRVELTTEGTDLPAYTFTVSVRGAVASFLESASGSFPPALELAKAFPNLPEPAKPVVAEKPRRRVVMPEMAFEVSSKILSGSGFIKVASVQYNAKMERVIVAGSVDASRSAPNTGFQNQPPHVQEQWARVLQGLSETYPQHKQTRSSELKGPDGIPMQRYTLQAANRTNFGYYYRNGSDVLNNIAAVDTSAAKPLTFNIIIKDGTHPLANLDLARR